MTLRVLYAASEALPYSKTGGLADVAHSLPEALTRLDVDVRLVTPAYRGVLERLPDAKLVGSLAVRGQEFRIWENGGCAPRAWLLECPALYARDGSPYADASGRDFDDNAWRFGCFGEAVGRLALGEVTHWRPDALHLNDWQTGLAAVWLRDRAGRPRVVFTIHNLAYQGVFERGEFDALGVPPELMHADALEFWGKGSFLKGGLVFSDALTTVSPTYAREIRTKEFGHGLDGLLQHRVADLHGILNGIEDEVWNPARDANLHTRYTAATVREGKRANKRALQQELGLEFGLELGDAPLVGVVSRLAQQKGIDQVLACGPELLKLPVQIAILGRGEAALEAGLQQWASEHPARVGVRIGFDEPLAHRIEAGADLFLMPSRYEPCGLNQMYSQRYGTIPVVRRVGGLADTVVDATASNFSDGTATGILFDRADSAGILGGLRRALRLRGTPRWAALQRNGMARDFSWRSTARRFLALYRQTGSS